VKVAVIALTCLLAGPAIAGDATKFMICRSDGCIELPSLKFLPKGQAPAATAAPPGAPAAPAPPHQDALSREIEADIVEFCDKHPDERFCGKLGLWLRQHPEPQR
jgi:hypothetical protein